MEIFRSLIFIPSFSTKMLDKIDTLNSDGFLLDLEDSVPFDKKIQARKNIKDKLDKINISKKLGIFVRTNELDSEYFYDDIKETIDPKVLGYMIPKFEDFNKLEEIINFILKQEKEKGISPEKTKLILMIENPKGVIELSKINNSTKRILALAIGWEDFTRSINVFSEISSDLLDYTRMTILLHAKANNLLAIDTIYKNFNDDEGLRIETLKAVKMGFNCKLAVHPKQIDIINDCFMPTDEEIKKMEIILENEERIKAEGAININGVMYDPPHLKWALKVKEYLNEINRKE